MLNSDIVRIYIVKSVVVDILKVITDLKVKLLTFF